MNRHPADDYEMPTPWDNFTSDVLNMMRLHNEGADCGGHQKGFKEDYAIDIAALIENSWSSN